MFEEDYTFLSGSLNNPANRFFAEQKARWPTLYNNWDSLVHSYIFTCKSTEWTDDGILISTEYKWDNDKKDFNGLHPFRMSLDDAWHSVADSGMVYFHYTYDDSSYSSIPINNLPNNLEFSYIYEIRRFLNKYDKISVEQYKNILEVNSLLREFSKESIDRYTSGYALFKKKIKNWLAKLENIEYIQRHGVFDPETIMGMYI